MEPKSSSTEPKITDFFARTSRPRCKRKIIEDDTPLVQAVSPVKIARKCPTKPEATKLCLSPTKSQVTKPTLSPIKLSTSKPTLSPFKSQPIKSTVSSIKTPIAQPCFSPVKSVPGKLCLSPVKSQTELRSPVKEKISWSSVDFSLPIHYQTLSKIFDSMDNVFSLLIGSNRQLTFEKLKSGVESMSKKTFDHIRLAQIKTLYPECISYSYENTNNAGKTSKVLVIRPTKLSDPSDPKSPLVPLDKYELINSSRSKELTKRLYDLAKKHHNEFLKEIYPSMRVDSSKLVRWHPKFKVDTLPPIPYDKDALPALSQAPRASDPRQSLSALLLKANSAKLSPPTPGPSQSDLISRVVASSSTVTSTVTAATTTNSTSETTASAPATLNVEKDTKQDKKEPVEKVKSGALKGISLALLNKVKAREAEKIARELTRPAEVQKNISMLRQFGELIRIVKFYFVGEKTNVIPIDKVAKKMVESYRAFMSPCDAIERLEYMSKILPEWLMILKVKQGIFVKLLNQDANPSIMQVKVNKLLDEMEKGIVVVSS